MKLTDVLDALRAVAPEHLAESWDPVGLQVGDGARRVRSALLCVDLTEGVVAEARERGCQLVVAYHPAIFRGLPSLTDGHWKERAIVAAVRSRLAVYSPHTALDNVRGGLTDWLCEGLGRGVETVPITRGAASEDAPDGEAPGSGRLHRLARAASLRTLVARVKERLGLAQVKVGAPAGGRSPRLRRVAVCPGSGGSVFEACRDADAYVTGELQHHDVLDLIGRGKAVVLTGHANSERPFLAAYRELLRERTADGVAWHVSRADRSPLSFA